MANKTILVTGTAGFIGYHLALRLLERGDRVVGLDNINDYYDIRLKHGRLAAAGIDPDQLNDNGTPVISSKYPAYSFIKADLADKAALSAVFADNDFDCICNLAAQAGVRYSLENPDAYISSNIAGFVNILEAARHYGTRHLVYASSSSVYGSNEKMPFSTADNVDFPVSLYAATKKSNELMAHCYSHLFGVPTTGLRFFTVYGPWGRPDMAPILFTSAISAGKPIKVFNFGQMKRDFTYIDDIVEGVVRVIDNPPAAGSTPGTNAPYKVYNIGNSTPVDLMAFIAAIEKALGREAIKEMLPMQPGDVPVTWADVSDLTANLGYKPNTPIQMGVDKFIEWYRSFYKG